MKTQDSMNNKAWLFAWATLCAISSTQAQQLDNFESYSDGQSLNDINSWKWNGTVSAISYSFDEANIGYPIPGSHTKVMDVNGVTGSLYSDSDQSMTVFTDMVVKPGQFRTAAQGHPALSDETSVGFYINENGHPVVAHVAHGTSNTVWTEISNVTLSASEWHRVTVQLDYRPQDNATKHLYYAIMVNGSYLTSSAGRADQTGVLASGIWFPMINQNHFDGIYLKGATASVDDVVLDGQVDYKGVSVAAASAYEPEAGQTVTAEFVISLSEASSSPVIVDYITEDITATAGQDYVATSGQVVIPAGSTEATVSVTVNGDAIADSDEQFALKITGVQNATMASAAQATGLILDDSGDADFDGLANGVELALGTDPEVGDTDGDGYSDYIENLDGSDPLDGSSHPVNPVNLAPYWANLDNGIRYYGDVIVPGEMEHVDDYGSEITIRAYANGVQVPLQLDGTDIKGFGPISKVWDSPDSVRFTFTEDTYFQGVASRKWGSSDKVRLTGPAIGRINALDESNGIIYTLDKAAQRLDISGNTSSIVDSVTGRGIQVLAGETLEMTYVGGSANPHSLHFRQSFLVRENHAVGTVLVDVNAVDPNSNDSLTYTITGGNDSGLFSIDSATGAVTLESALNYASNTSHQLEVSVTDLAGLVTNGTVDIQVFAADSDADSMDDLIEYRLFGALSTSDGTGDSDGDGQSDANEVNGGTNPLIFDSNFAPTASNASGLVSENAAVGTLVTTVSASDPDAGDSLSYAITGGNIGNAFAIDGNGNVTVAAELDYDVASSYTLTVSVTDNGSPALSDTATVLVTVAEVNEPPVISSTGTPSAVVAAFGVSGAVNGAANYESTINGVTMTMTPESTHTDPDTIGFFNPVIGVTGGGANKSVDNGEKLIVSFDQSVLFRGFAGGNFASGETIILSSTAFDGLTGVTGATYDDATDSVSRQGNDITALDDSRTENGILIPKGTVVEYSVGAGNKVSYKGITVSTLGVLELAENSSIGTTVTTITASDPDEDEISYAITEGNTNGAFAIDSNGEITVAGVLDYETQAIYDLTVEVTAEGGSDTAVVSIYLSDEEEINQAPEASDASFDLAENSASGAVVGMLVASDVDPGTSLSYAITAGNEAGFFAIDANGEITTTASLDHEVVSQYVLTVEVSDGELTDSATVTVNVTDVNEAPSVADASATLVENGSNGEAVASLVSSDPDNDTLSYQITAGNAEGLFAIDANGNITTTAGLDFESASQHVLTVEVSDGELTDTAVVTIDVSNANEAPVASDLAGGVNENIAGGQVIGTVGVSDADAGDSFGYAITAGNGLGFFAIDTNGQVTTTSSLDFETASGYALTVTVTDAGGLSDTAQVNVTVNNVNEAPTASNASGSVAENGSAGAVIGTVATSDPEGDSLTYQITGGNGSGHFAIDSNGQVTTTGALDHEAASQHVLTVEVSDGEFTDTAQVTVDVTDVNEAPSASNASGSVAENGSAGAVIGTVATSDPEGDSLTYQITGGNGSGHFAIDSNGQVTTTGALDFESASQHVLTVEVSDGELTDTAQVTANVSNVNEAPVANNTSGSVSEDASIGTTVASVAASDPDAGASLNYSITAGNTGNAFSIDSNGNVKVASALDYETTTSYTLTVQVSDGSLSDTAQVTVNVTDVVEVTVASIATGASSNITQDSADIAYSISDEGNEAPTVTVFYGETDGGQSAAAWDSSVNAGVQNAGSYVEQLVDLTEGTEYYYSVRAVNSAGEAWGSVSNFTTEADTSPKLVRTTVAAVSSTSWTTVDLGQNYNSAVVITTPIYADNTQAPIVTRIRNVSGSSFELKLDRADGLTEETTADVSVVAVEEGVYTLAEDGVQMEAVKFTSTVTAENNSWSSEARTMQNSYTAPVVVGQVMSYNDSNWSVFWTSGSSRTSIPSTASFNAGKHVGEDPNAVRADETVGYIVIETGSGTINGVAYEAAVGSKSVRGFGNSPDPYTYTLNGNLVSASAAAISSAGMSGNNGAWAVLSGVTPLEANSIDLHVSEDKMNDSETSHNTTNVGYLIFE